MPSPKSEIDEYVAKLCWISFVQTFCANRACSCIELWVGRACSYRGRKIFSASYVTLRFSKEAQGHNLSMSDHVREQELR